MDRQWKRFNFFDKHVIENPQRYVPQSRAPPPNTPCSPPPPPPHRDHQPPPSPATTSSSGPTQGVPNKRQIFVVS